MGRELNHQQQLRCRNTSKLLSIVIMALKPGRPADQGVVGRSSVFSNRVLFLKPWDFSVGVLFFLLVGCGENKYEEK